MVSETVAYVALGSNLGVRGRWIRRALKELHEHPSMSVLQVSSLWETLAQGRPQPNYFNAVAEVGTRLRPRAMVEALLAVETRMGRVRRGRWLPRRIDLDLLLWGDVVMDEPNCTVPHPRMHERPFVLAPLSELAPHAVHPRLGRSIAEILKEVGHDGLVRRESARGRFIPRH